VDDAFRRGAIGGGYWLRPKGPNCDVVIACQGMVAPEAIRAAGLIAENRRDAGVPAVTSADRPGWRGSARTAATGPSLWVSIISRRPVRLAISTLISDCLRNASSRRSRF